jgi:flagellar FliJ protein
MRHATDWRRLKDIAEETRDRTAQRVAEARRAADAARQKLDMLIGYRRDYDARLARSAGDGIDMAKLRGYRTFLANLEQAIGQQADVVTAAEQKLVKAQDAWRQEQRRVESFRVLDERRATTLARAAGRNEQKLTDEIATQSPAMRGGDD